MLKIDALTLRRGPEPLLENANALMPVSVWLLLVQMVRVKPVSLN